MVTKQIATQPANYEIAAGIFARTGSLRRTAKRSGATMEQVEDWLEEPAFRALVAAEQKQMEKATLSEIFQHAPHAVAIVSRLMRNSTATKNAPVRLSAARTMIEFWFKAQEFFALRRELDEIKRQLAEQGVGKVIDVGVVESLEADDPKTTED